MTDQPAVDPSFTGDFDKTERRRMDSPARRQSVKATPSPIYAEPHANQNQAAHDPNTAMTDQPAVDPSSTEDFDKTEKWRMDSPARRQSVTATPSPKFADPHANQTPSRARPKHR
ncbi:MAG TPA: hypothetical protein DIU04_00895, partial [Pseudomonas sp.]|nr:hypothetical protein [Pseudomonas sp.]